MAEIRLSESYQKERDIYDSYLKRSAKIRLGINISVFCISLGFLFIIIGTYFNMKILPIYLPEYSFNYFYSIISILLFLGGSLLYVSLDLYHERIKKFYNYREINFPFIYSFESYIFMKKYLETNMEIEKIDSINALNKCMKIIKKWSYGNIPIIFEPVKEQIDFIKKDLDLIIKKYLKSDNPKERNISFNLIISLSEFLNSKNINSLNILYSYGNEFKLKEPFTIRNRIKNILKPYIESKPAESQLIFSLIIALIIIITSIKLNVNTKEMITWIIMTLLGSFGIFEWIKKYIFQIR